MRIPYGFFYCLKAFCGMFWDIFPPEMDDRVSEEKKFFIIFPAPGTVAFNFFDPIIGIFFFFQTYFYISQCFP